MGGGATNRFFSLLSTTAAPLPLPLPLLFLRRRHSSLSLLLLRRRSSHNRHFLALSPPLSSAAAAAAEPIEPSRRRFHSRAATSLHDHLSPPSSHPWPEWARLLDALSAAGYFDRAEVHDLAHLPPEFAPAAGACLVFARERAGLVRLLSRKDVEMVVRNGTPFLFKEANNTNVLEMNKVSTVDLMKFLLSYVSNFIFPSESNNLYNRELVESSARNLLVEMAKLCYVVSDSKSFDTERNKFTDRNGESTRPFGQGIEMKRGDWICPRCTFMNFARNMKCLECEEARPKSQLTGGEWECPQCVFFNYGRNAVCLRCDCKRPGQISVGTNNTRLGTSAYEDESNSSKADIDRRLADNEEKAQRWFSKISQLDGASDMSSAVADDDFPEIMPLRKGVNRFVVSTRKTPLERRLANSQYQTNSGKGEAGPSSNFSSVSPQYGQPGGRNSNYVPFVPLSPDMFAKKPENSEAENRGKEIAGSDEFVAPNTGERVSNDKSRELVQKSSNQAEMDIDKEQIEKSDRWFKKVAELHNVTDLASAISDEDFPEIMPMRKGENRFVVSKKKDRSLISPAYKRQMAMEQASDTKFVPFVPFPPDYFAKKDDKPQANGADLGTKDASELPDRLDNARPSEHNKDRFQQTDNRSGLQSWNSETSPGNLSVNQTDGTYEPPASGSVSRSYTNSVSNNNDMLGSSGIFGKETPNAMPNSTRSSLQPPENQNNEESWRGKSLEGSAVKESDPLDMSEEAKAERWFRRVAQIKDISELSQIPDEDFPSIMPMRKGVNRFVVSKRKTPLERRLTSPQYRRNLPIVGSDPIKKENDNS